MPINKSTILMITKIGIALQSHSQRLKSIVSQYSTFNYRHILIFIPKKQYMDASHNVLDTSLSQGITPFNNCCLGLTFPLKNYGFEERKDDLPNNQSTEGEKPISFSLFKQFKRNMALPTSSRVQPPHGEGEDDSLNCYMLVSP